VAQVFTWWKEFNPEAIGIPTGSAPGFWVLDIDGEEGEANLKGIEAEYGPLPVTVEQLLEAVPGMNSFVGLVMES